MKSVIFTIILLFSLNLSSFDSNVEAEKALKEQTFKELKALGIKNAEDYLNGDWDAVYIHNNMIYSNEESYNRAVELDAGNNQEEIRRTQLFFNIFKDARMYFNVLYDRPLIQLCEEPAFPCTEKNINIKEGDYYIRDIQNTNGNDYFLIEIGRNSFFVNANTFINQFDLNDFFEKPQNMVPSRDVMEQIERFNLNNINNNINLTLFADTKTFDCNNEIITYNFNCPSANQIPEDSYQIRLIRMDDNFIYFNFLPAARNEFKITKINFYRKYMSSKIQKNNF